MSKQSQVIKSSVWAQTIDKARGGDDRNTGEDRDEGMGGERRGSVTVYIAYLNPM